LFLVTLLQVAEISETNSVLREELRLKEESATEERRALESRIDTLQRETTSLNAELLSVRSQLSSAPSQAVVENMKRELRILKRLEYNADDTAPEIAGEVDEETDLEAVLVAKLRRAESELVTERTSRADLVKETAELKKALEEAEHSKRESDRLVASLEKDLEHAIASSTSHSAIKSQHPRSKSEVITTKENPETLRSILEPSAGSGTPTPTPPLLAPTPKEASAKEKADDDHSVATIVMAQRDRLRARCDALERERDSFKRELQAQVQASESLKSDNTKLYEKVRYLQNYKNPPSSSGPYSRSSSMTDRDLDLETLEQRYEASVDPFKQFSKNERQRKLAEMSPMERTVFVVAKTVLCKSSSCV
jgi:homeobox protein cut-like